MDVLFHWLTVHEILADKLCTYQLYLAKHSELFACKFILVVTHFVGNI